MGAFGRTEAKVTPPLNGRVYPFNGRGLWMGSLRVKWDPAPISEATTGLIDKDHTNARHHDILQAASALNFVLSLALRPHGVTITSQVVTVPFCPHADCEQDNFREVGGNKKDG